MAPIRLVSCAKAFRGLSHQTAALEWLQEQIPEEVLAEFAEMFRADPPVKPQASPSPGTDWLTPCRRIVQEFEGCRLEAYPDPGTGGDPWTIGWGHTGPQVQQGLTWTQQQADIALDAELSNVRADAAALLPMLTQWPANQQAALISFAYNVGTGALEASTLRQRLLAGEDPATVAREELPRWNKGGSGVMPGLVRRREAEVSLFVGNTQSTNKVLLSVPYEYQNDNTSGTGGRECFSSSCAMVAKYYDKVINDDAYNTIRARFGDSTDPGAQLRALGSLGLQAAFRKTGDASTLEKLLSAGQPVPVGWLHHGPVSAPSGGGHWSVVIGFDADAFVFNDPNGEADILNGGYVSTAPTVGRGIRYSRANWLRRWEVDGRSTGWYLDVRA